VNVWAETGTAGVPRLPVRSGRPVGPILTTAGLAAGCLYVGLVDPRTGVFPVCPFHAVTGWWCPGCGTTRALHALLHGHLGVAVHDNVAFVMVLPLLVYSYLAWLRPRSRWRPFVLGPWMTWGALTGLVVFGVLRNLEPFRFLAPG